MALSNLPIIWSAQVLAALRGEIVFAAPGIANRDYEGEIKAGGDRVKIRGIADPTIFDVTANTDIPAPETLSDSASELVIDKAKGFNFQVDDLDKIQKAGGGSVLSDSAINAARKLAEAADTAVAAECVANTASGMKIGTTASPIQIDAPMPGATLAAGAIDAYRLIGRIATKLTKANTPRSGRWAVVPPFIAGALAQDPRFTQAGGTALLANGFRGSVGGIAIYETTLVPSPASTKYQIVAGYSGAISYAEQLTEVEFYKPERRFADAVKGLHVFGSKVVRPNNLVVATVQDVSGLDA